MRCKFFMCIGAPRCSTTWLYHQLRGHPEIDLLPRKELHYFDTVYLYDFLQRQKMRLQSLYDGTSYALEHGLSDRSRANLRWLSRYALVDQVEFNDKWYVSLFEEQNPQKWTGDFSPGYCALPLEGVRHVHRVVGDIPLFLVLRHPVERAISAALYAIRFDADLRGEECQKRIRNIVFGQHEALYDDYRQMIETWLSVFPRSRLCILFHDQIVDAPMIFLEKVCGLLNIAFDPAYFPKIGKRFNRSARKTINPRIIEELTDKHAEQIDWLAREFGGYAETWAERALANLKPRPPATPNPD